MYFLFTKTASLFYTTGILFLSVTSGLPYYGSDSTFSSTEVPYPSCSSYLEPETASSFILNASLEETSTCMERTQYPKTDKIYQQLFQVKELVQSDDNGFIPEPVQAQIRNLKYDLEKQEIFLESPMLGFTRWYWPLIIWYLMIVISLSLMLDLVLAHQGYL